MAKSKSKSKTKDLVAKSRFLAVDDEDFSLFAIERMLRFAGANEVAVARNGAEAIQIMMSADKPIDCVVSDLNMTPVNGLEMLKVIRLGFPKVERTTRVIMVTGLQDVALAQMAIELDVNGFLSKPISAKGLAQSITSALTRVPFVKPPAIYKEIATPTEDALAQIATATGLSLEQVNDQIGKADDAPANGHAASQGSPAKTNGKPAKQSPLARYPEAILEENVESASGDVLIKAGTELTDYMIERLQDLREIDESLKHVWIKIREKNSKEYTLQVRV